MFYYNAKQSDQGHGTEDMVYPILVVQGENVITIVLH